MATLLRLGLLLFCAAASRARSTTASAPLVRQAGGGNYYTLPRADPENETLLPAVLGPNVNGISLADPGAPLSAPPSISLTSIGPAPFTNHRCDILARFLPARAPSLSAEVGSVRDWIRGLHARAS